MPKNCETDNKQLKRSRESEKKTARRQMRRKMTILKAWRLSRKKIWYLLEKMKKFWPLPEKIRKTAIVIKRRKIVMLMKMTSQKVIAVQPSTAKRRRCRES